MITSSSSERYRRTRHFLWAALLAVGLIHGSLAEPISTQAVSSDGLWRLTAEPATRTLLLQDTLGMQVRRYPWPDVSAQAVQIPPIVSVLLQNQADRRSFVAAFGGSLELWEISYDRAAQDIYDGLVHDYRMREGLSRPGFLGVRRTRLEQPLDDFWIDTESPQVLGRARWAQGELQVVNLDIRRVRATWPLPAQARLTQAQRVTAGTQSVLRIPVALLAPAGSGSSDICLSLNTWSIVLCAMEIPDPSDTTR